MELDEWVERCKAGDKEAQAWLYRTYSQKMLRICRSLVSDRQVALDLMHDGFVLVFASIGALKQTSKLEGWMGRIMTNLSLKYINQQRAAFCVPLTELSENEEPIDGEAAPESIPLDVLLGMIEKLPEGYRRIFKLSVLDEMSHKEIAELLHIAPHSSSSQFYRAKEYLKRLITEHCAQLLVVLLLVLPLVGYWMWREVPVTSPVLSDTPAMEEKPEISKPRQEEQVAAVDTVSLPGRKRQSREIASVIALLPADTTQCPDGALAGAFPPADTVRSSGTRPVDVAQSSEATSNKTDSTRTLSPIHLPGRKSVYRPERMALRVPRKSGWMLDLRYSNGRSSNALSGVTIATPPGAHSGVDPAGPLPPYVNNWNDYYRYLQQDATSAPENKHKELLREIAGRNRGKKIEEQSNHYIPLTVGVVLHKTMDRRWGVETGVQYTRLESDFVKGEGAYIGEKQKLHYLGIPLRATYQLARYKRFTFYTSAGVLVEIPLSGTLETEYIIDGKMKEYQETSLKAPLQWSVDGGVGVQYNLMPSVGIFAEPKVNYYFDDGSLLRTLRKEHPFGFTLPIGIRWTY